MKPTLRILSSARGRTPLIHFLGPRKNIQTEPHVHHPHYLAPPEGKGEAFESFLKKLDAPGAASPSGGNTASKSKQAYTYFWDVPKYSQLRLPEMSDTEMEEVMSGGASSWR